MVGVDLVQEHVFGQGPQDNESALEQAKDEQISDCMISSLLSLALSSLMVSWVLMRTLIQFFADSTRAGPERTSRSRTNKSNACNSFLILLVYSYSLVWETGCFGVQSNQWK